MNDFLKKNFVIVLAFLLPVAVIAIVALSTYLPSFLLTTDYNFVYSSCTGGVDYPYYCENYLQKRFTVVDGKLTINEIDPYQDSDKDGIPDVKESYTARLFLHDTTKNESREITLEEAQALSFSGLLTSPDGVTVSSNYDRGGDYFLFFDGHSSYGYYLTKGRIRSKLNLINGDDRYYYRDNFQFVGWVLPSTK